MQKSKKKKKGFTLTELLAVIVILAVIALIATPLISAILGRAKKSTFTRNIENITKTIEIYIYDQNNGKIKDLTTFKISPEGIIKISDDTSLKHEGEIDGVGQIIVDKNGRYNIYYTNQEFCATKSFENEKITITDGDCTEIENENISFIFSDDSNPIYVQKGSNYLLPDVTAYTITGDKIENVTNVISRINNDGTIINNAQLDTNAPVGTKYEVTYLANKDDQTATKKITIIIADFTKAYLSPITITNTTNSGTIYFNAYDTDSGIKKVEYILYLDDKIVDNYVENTNTSNTMISTNFNHKFSGLKTDTKYKIVVKVTNGSDEVTESSKEFTTLAIGKPTISVTPTEYSQKKSVTINYPEGSNLQFKYVIGTATEIILPAGNNEVTFDVDTNTTISAVITDGTNSVNSVTYNITKIDNTKPDFAVLSVSGVNANEAKLIITSEDGESGIYGYQFSKDGGTTWYPDAPQESNTYTFTNLEPANYSFVGKAFNGTYDKYGFDESKGTTKTNTINKTIKTCSIPTYSITPANTTWAQAKEITIDYGNDSDCKGEYSLDNGLTWQSGTNVTIKTNQVLIAKNTDKSNVAVASSFVITNVDTTAPDSLSFSTTRSTRSISITASATDNQSGIAKYAFSKDDGATWTAWQTSNQYKYDGLTTNTYKIKVRVYNVAYENTSNSLKNDSQGIKTSSVQNVELISCPTPTYIVTPSGTTWAEAKTVSINYGSEPGCVGYYSIDGGSTWTQENSVVIKTNNTNVIAKNTDGVNTVTASAQLVNYIDMTAPDSLSFTTTKTTKSITITASATDNQSGIAKYAFSKDDGSTWTDWQTSNRYTFDNLVTGTYKIKVKVVNVAHEGTATSLKDDSRGIKVSTTSNVTLDSCPIPTYSYPNTDGSKWTQAKVININYGSTAGCNGSYSTDGGSTWKTGTSVTYTANGNLVAKNTDGTNTVTASVENVIKIDTSKPTDVSFTTSQTTQSITITASATDAQSGIAKYAFSKDNGSSWTGWQTSNVYTFEQLTTNTYNIKVKVYNVAYENTVSSLKNDDQGITTTSTSSRTLSSCPIPTYSYSNNNGSSWTQVKVLNINYGSEPGCNGLYSIDGGSTWKTGTSQTFTANGNLVAKNTDGTNTVTASSEAIIKIDTSAPTASTHTTTKTTKSITVTASGADSQSGILKYNFSKDDGSSWTGWQDSNTYTFNNLTSGTYKIKTKVYNGTYGSASAVEATGSLASATSNITLDNCPKPTYSYANNNGSSWTQNKVVNIDYGSTAGCNGSYSTDGGSTWQTGTSVTFTANGNLVAKNTDGTNTVTATSEAIIKIDRTVPDTVSFTTTKTTKSISITASATDNQSGISAYAFSKDDGKNWSGWQTSNTYTFNNLTTDTYKIKVKAYNGTYGSYGATESLGAKDSSGSTTLDGCGIPTFSVIPSGSVWSQSKTVTINYNSPSGFIGYYSIDGGTTWTEGSSLTTSTNGQAILARATDGVNTCNSSSALTISYLDASKPTASTHTTTKTTKSITVTASGTDSQSGITRYSFRINDGAWSAWQTSNQYKFDDLATGTYKIQTKVYNGTYGSTGATESVGALESTTSNVTLDSCPIPTYSLSAVNGYGWAQYRTVTINYGSTSGCTGSYSTDGGTTWNTGTSVTMNANGNVVAKNTDGKNTVTASSQAVSGIDPSAPTASTHSYTKTTNSITVTASGTDGESGIKMYSFKIDSGSWTTWQSGNSYTFTGLTTGNHTVQSRVFNGTYGSIGATEAKGALASSASTVTLSGCTAPTMSVSPSGSTWAQYKTVTINGSSGFTTYYSTNGGTTWTSGSSVTVTTNNTNVIAKVSDGTNTCNSTATQTVNYIDRTTPTASSHSTSRTASSITVTASGTDSESGISRYSFRINNGSWTAWQASNVYTFNSLSASTTYTVQSRVYNGTYGTTGASETYGVKESSSSSVTTLSNCPTPTFSVSPSGSAWATSRTVTINYGSTSGCTGSYSKNGGSWTSGTSVSFTANGYVTARNVDGAGNAVSSTQNVTNIDSNTPSASLTVTSNGSTIGNGGSVSTTTYATLTCSNSGGSGIGSYYIEARDSLYSTVINSTSSSSLSFNPASSTSGSITITAYCTTGAGKQSSTFTHSVVYSGSGGITSNTCNSEGTCICNGSSLSGTIYNVCYNSSGVEVSRTVAYSCSGSCGCTPTYTEYPCGRTMSGTVGVTCDCSGNCTTTKICDG